VLGGGGAKGAAHVGVLGVLEELRIPIDCIVGTSMGALVGGTFASGMDAQELEQVMRSISWQEATARSGLRNKVPMRRKLAGNTYSNSLEFGVRGGRLVAPSGLINSQNVDLTIQYLVARSRGISDFDRLPIPFRAVATDMQTGEMAVLGKGDLALAMRASMAVPGAFAPVTIDGRILGDGGLTRNVPVDIARQTCADVVIAVAVPSPAPRGCRRSRAKAAAARRCAMSTTPVTAARSGSRARSPGSNTSAASKRSAPWNPTTGSKAS
jgi:NTE family protein